MNEARDHLGSERLQAYVEGSLDGARRAEVEAHLSMCARCQGDVEELEGIFNALAALPELAPSAGFVDRVMSGVRVRRPAFAGAGAWAESATGWLERLLPQTTRGWAATAALLALPALGATLLITWLLSQPGVTPQGLWLMTTTLAGEGLATASEWAWSQFAATTLAAWLAQGIGLAQSIGRGEIGLLAVTFATLTAGSIYVLYQNLFRTDSRRTEHATYVF